MATKSVRKVTKWSIAGDQWVTLPGDANRETVVLTGRPAGQGGTGKTQLAIGFARARWHARAAQR